MPEVLDRCVAQLRGRGVSESSAFAICTASLQRTGRLRRSTAAVSARYRAFATRVNMPDILDPGMSAGFPTLSSDDMALVERLRSIGLTDRPNVLGLARLHSRRIEINHDSLGMVGHKPIWYAAVLVHESVHANLGFGEQEATRIEQRYAGKRFGEALLERDRETLSDSLLVAGMVQGQRLLQVHKRDRRDDFQFLTGAGFTKRAARRVLRLGAIFHQRMLEQQEVAQSAKSFATKQFMVEPPQACVEIVEKTVTQEFRRVLFAQFLHEEDEIVAKALGEADDACEMRGSPADRRLLEWAVQESIARGFGLDERRPMGIVPAMRRAGMNASLLGTAAGARHEALTGLLEEAASVGLWDSDGVLTDVHVKMLMYGYSPVLARVKKEVIDAEEETPPGDSA